MKVSPKALSIITLTAGVCTLAASTTYAQMRGPIDIAEMEERAEARFTRLDTNANSEIDLDEFLAAPSFQAAGGQGFDRGNGRAKMKKRMQMRKAMGRARFDGPEGFDPEALKEAMQSEAFKLMDQDGDGDISAAEFAEADQRAVRGEARKRAIFSQLDADDSGTLSRDEVPSIAERLREIDLDNDGQVTKQERRAARQAHNGRAS
ncbi:MAG: hypothetical protein AAF541_00355 [Pseudomonadota bacterium]